jgi:hypothetical protein
MNFYEANQNLIAVETEILVSLTLEEIQELTTYVETEMRSNWKASRTVFHNLRALRIACLEAISIKESEPKKSNGHLEFINDFEFFIYKENLYKARISNAFDIQGNRLGASWEAPPHMINDILEAHKSFVWQPGLI